MKAQDIQAGDELRMDDDRLVYTVTAVYVNQKTKTVRVEVQDVAGPFIREFDIDQDTPLVRPEPAEAQLG